ncbi:beta-lactamase family protein [Branchiibius hedensis]|uniref:Beta-lactamase enzyme family protein n=2 Tax=Branchiibius hedensis TaxID=672460 RepID=A0A2Y8ZNT5_9MICO|nr:beta-lactamase family protein [Branchiibius hedensis]SSA33990.1 Beta-lactamase enzyme family protein [Branchiibius hedensis]
MPALAACANAEGRPPVGRGSGQAPSGARLMSTASTPPVPSISRAALTAVAAKYLATRTATLGFSLHDHRTGVQLHYRPMKNETASSIKVLVLAATLRIAAEKKRSLTATQKALATQMIEYSDNNATTTLFRAAGYRNVQRVAGLFGLTSTTINPAWGISTTTPADWVKLMDHVVRGSTVLSVADRAYIRSLMSHVTTTQRWGVANPPVTGATIALTKNGWLPYKGVWRVNSMGYLEGHGRKYTLAILSRSPKGFDYGVQTLNGLSTTLFTALSKQLVA